MEKEYKKEITKRIFSIIYTTTFLIGSTWFWFGPREDILRQKEEFDKKYIYVKTLDFKEITRPLDIDGQ